MTRRLRRIPAPLAVLFLLATVQTVTWALVLPPLQGPDEVGHFSYAQRIVEQKTIPFERTTQINAEGVDPYSKEVNIALTQAGFGPLAGNVSARPYWTRADFELWSQRDAAAGPGVRKSYGFTSTLKNPPLYYVYEAVPYALATGGSFFDRSLVMRLANIPLLLTALGFVWLMAGELLGRGRPQIIATASVALIPQLSNVTGAINSDALVIPIWCAALYLCVLVLRRGARRRFVLPLILLAIAGALTHQRSLPLIAPVFAAILIAVARERGWRRITPARVCLATLGTFAAVALAVAEYDSKGHAREFVSYVWQFYLPKLGFMQTALGPEHYRFRQAVPDRLFGTLAQLEVVLPKELETFAYWLTLGLFAGMLAALIARRRAVRPSSDVVWVFLVAVVTLIGTAHLAAYRGLIYVPGDPVFTGRYLLPLIPLIGVGLALIARALPARVAAVYCGLLLAIGVAFQLESIGLLVERFYA